MTGDDRASEDRPADTTAEGGTYTLLLVREESGDVTVGALGSVHLPAGSYAYVGSALGTGGFARVDRHRRVAAGDHDTQHWHVDYLTSDDHTRLASVVTTGGVDAECRIAEEIRSRLTTDADSASESSAGLESDSELEPDPIAGFGASDCGCRTHLFGHESFERLETVVSEAHETVRK